MTPTTIRPRIEPLEARTMLSTCHVTRLSDSGVGKGFRGDLRYCITKVNAEPGPDAIDFKVSGTINLMSALPDLRSDIDIWGPGQNVLTVRRNDAETPFRIFHIVIGTVRISGLTVANGQHTIGGGIANHGALLLDDVQITLNTSSDQGGGVYNGGSLQIVNSTIANNRMHKSNGGATYLGGGGIYNAGFLTIETSHLVANTAFAQNTVAGGGLHNTSGGTAIIRFSTISDNSSETTVNKSYGGGIYNDATLTITDSAVVRNGAIDTAPTSGSVFVAGGGIHTSCAAPATLIINSTIAENFVDALESNEVGVGGGIYDDCEKTTIKHSTIARNLTSTTETAYAGGIYGDVYMFNSIVADNWASDGGADYCGTLQASGHNLFGDSDCVSGAATTDLLDVDPLVGPLADNGGPTLTIALLPGSPAIDAGDNTDAPEWDQRGPGFPRIVNGTIDIGAFEVQSTPTPGPDQNWSVLLTADLQKKK